VSAFAVRDATVADARTIATVHVRSWQAGYRGIVDDGVLDGLSIDRRERAWQERLTAPGDASRTLVAERDGAVIGFCGLATPSRDADAAPATAEIAAIYVDPEAWRAGIGTALLDAALDGLARDGWTDVTLWVLEQNARGRAFYERSGFAPDGERHELRDLGQYEIRLARALP
jgi:GNAT superfamily N-acetyltransferase